MRKKRKSSSKSSLKKARKRFTAFVLTIGLITIVSVTALGIYSVRNIFKPISSEASTLQPESNYSENQYSIFVVNKKSKDYLLSASLVMIDVEENTVRELTLPAETLLHLPYGLDEFKLQSLYKIAQLENPDSALMLMDKTLTSYFGVAAKDIIIINNDTTIDPFFQWLINPVNLFKLTFDEHWSKENIISSQSRWELVNIAKDIMTVHSSNRVSNDIVSIQIGKVSTDIDKSTTIQTDQNKLDIYIKKTFENTSIAEEKANIVIQNNTQVNGLASQVGRLITNMGGIVVELKNGSNQTENTEIYISDNKWNESRTLFKILKAIPNAVVKDNSYIETKSDITVSLGKDYAKLLYGNISE